MRDQYKLYLKNLSTAFYKEFLKYAYYHKESYKIGNHIALKISEKHICEHFKIGKHRKRSIFTYLKSKGYLKVYSSNGGSCIELLKYVPRKEFIKNHVDSISMNYLGYLNLNSNKKKDREMIAFPVEKVDKSTSQLPPNSTGQLQATAIYINKYKIKTNKKPAPIKPKKEINDNQVRLTKRQMKMVEKYVHLRVKSGEIKIKSSVFLYIQSVGKFFYLNKNWKTLFLDMRRLKDKIRNTRKRLAIKEKQNNLRKISQRYLEKKSQVDSEVAKILKNDSYLINFKKNMSKELVKEIQEVPEFLRNNMVKFKFVSKIRNEISLKYFGLSYDYILVKSEN